jgi:hypothetical protein
MKNLKQCFSLLMIICVSISVSAQDNGRQHKENNVSSSIYDKQKQFDASSSTHAKSWEDYFNELGSVEDFDSESWEQAYDELGELAANPMDLNRCTRQDLERLFFLSEQQVMDIMEYRQHYGRFESKTELLMIPSLSRQQSELLSFFVTIGPETPSDTIPSLRSVLHRGKSEWVGTIKIPFYQREGDKDGYLGYPYKHWMRYTYTAGQQVKVGLVVSQDAGEPFFAGKNSAGYDFASVYLMLRNIKRLKAAVIGRYRLNFGMGLVLNNSFGLGKTATLSTLGRQTNSIYGHSSRSEANYLQGAAATIALTRKIDLTAFASWRKIDATLNDNGNITTILTSGYHRTESEMRRRRNAAQTLAGGNLNFFHNGFHVGLTALYTTFDRELAPDKRQRFRRWYPNGKNFWNLGINYGYLSNRLTIAGETATGDCHNIATLNTVSYQASAKLSLVLLQRYYAYQYYSLFSNSFAEGGSVNNESGIYLGANFNAARNLTLQAYTDFCYFAWDKYLTLPGSHAWDNMLTATMKLRRWNLLARYRLKLREHDNNSHTALEYRAEQRGRLSLEYGADNWNMRTQADLAYTTQGETRSTGWMVCESAAAKWGKWRIAASAGYFHTDDYDSRLYIYERSVLYQFSFPVLYGEGIHYALNLRADFGRNLMVMAKLSTTNYFDRNHISSGKQQIDHSSMTDLEIQARWKF